ncbi:2,5-dichloro-2,5-cyclohexadiene-1,4-diol dehydrogenase LinC [Novosphingobium colocasiae]|uniref:2,5-dichloro-2,5-cyclohexadiene-1,4-diol dehydrogenase LinC n=1 Tax=Novosphingobium colocasiae TaxID=1256513 RepID=UPI001E55F4B3|nr:2,5-dichloro-2,5-cyclohexadiene-1,4-diol dehydrogenase LinC [Novosphingobium colocasiae]
MFIVTGGASGIGRATVELLIERGARVALADIDDPAGEAVVAAAKGNAIYVHCDIGSEEDVKALVARTIDTFGALDGAFNNAAIPQAGLPLADVSLERFRQSLDINVVGTFLCMKYQILSIIGRGTKGSIVNTASAAGVVGVPMHGEYVGSKHAVVGLTRVAAADYGKHGIRVNALVPGAVRTPMLQRAMDNDPGLEPYLNSIHPIGRFSEPAEQAEAAVWLLSDAASFVTGACLAVDGGFTTI